MGKVISKLGMGSVCMMVFILLCSVFTSKNAFSALYWKWDYMKMYYNQKDKIATFDFIFYVDQYAHINDNFLADCSFYYSKDSDVYTCFMKAHTFDQRDVRRKIFMRKLNDEKIKLLNCVKPAHGSYWPDNSKDLMIEVNVMDDKVKDIDDRSYIAKRSHLKVLCHLPSSCNINYIKIKGLWASNGRHRDEFERVYKLDLIKLNSNTMNNAPSVLKSESSNNMMVTGYTDAISITGAEPGENIKVYTVTGVEVKSVIVNDDVVNIKLPTNQIYIVKAGQVRCKVAL